VTNISGGGAAILAERVPAPGWEVWLRLESTIGAGEPFPARAIATSTDPSGKQLIRVRFRSWIPLDGLLEQSEERRFWQRYPARESRALLSWIEEARERTVPGDLLNISGGGAAVASDVEPPAESPIWFGLEAQTPAIDPVESRLVVISLDASGAKIIRLRFVEPCPMALFELAVQGAM
jgi:hypothetical protein